MKEFHEADVGSGEPKGEDTDCPISPPSPIFPKPKVSSSISIHTRQSPWKLNFFSLESNGYHDSDDEEEWVPPHVIVARRSAAQMRFSGCYGTGRTIGWRQMTSLRDTVHRLTGYIEA
ncbi:hypothetical protein MRB53_026706 [Persea americana]|uniref:Uncharacterized protein n=1 Tax=Persea americana TaxID=3435 RepID=A0ACC2LJ53_PERAE|nr:hypothetical protein MRB53_026706 [Persea americana]